MVTHRIFVLGTPRLVVNEQVVELPSAKAVALIAYLALTEAAVPRERLVGLLWSESLEDAARKNLRNTLWAIRKALGEDVVRAQADRLALSTHVWVDVRAFERLTRSALTVPLPGAPDAPVDRAQDYQAASTAYGGALLDGVTLQEAPEFETWLTATRERLHQQYMRVLHESVELARTQERWDDLITTAQQALAQDPFQEPLHQRLMEALARRGKRAEALRQYETLRALLERELGVAPLPETEALRATIRDNALMPAHAQVTLAQRLLPEARPPVLGERAPTPFVGRDAELVALDTALERSLSGHPSVVLLTGDVGIGKTRLWREWSAHLAPGITVLEMRNLSATQALPFTPLVGLFSSRVCVQQLFHPGSPVAPLWLAEVARLLPEVRVAVPNLPQAAALPPDEERRRLFEAFVQCLRALNADGLVLFIDDLQWVDQATLDWLAYLLSRLQDRPLLLVATYRAEEASLALVRQIVAWRREGLLEQLHLEGLADAEIAALIAGLPGGQERGAQVCVRSGGNPYFAIELLRAGPDEVPLVLADLVRARLERLPEGARQVLQAAAVLEPDISYAALRRTSGRSDEEALDALDALLHAALLVERAGDYHFAHPLIATVVLSAMSQARQMFLHRRAAEACEALASGRLLPIAGRLAQHYEQAGDTSRAAQFADLAADHALSLAAPAEATGLLQRALALEPTAERWLKLGHALERLGDLAAARTALGRALESFAAQGNQAMARRTRLDLAYSFLSSGQADLTIQTTESILAEISADVDPYSAAYAEFLIGAGMQQRGLDRGATEQHLRAAAAIADAHDLPQITAHSQFQLGNLLAEAGDLPAALTAFHEAIRLAHTAGDLFQQVLGYNNAAYHSMLTGDIAGAHALIDTGLALNERQALRVPLQWLYSTRGEIALADAQWGEAEAWFERGLSEAEQQHNQVQIAGYYANLGRAAQGRGDLERALEWLTQAQARAATLAARHLQNQIDLWLAEVHLQRGERAAARAQLATVEARTSQELPGLIGILADRLRTQLAE